MKAFGAGAAISVLGGSTVAQEDDEMDDEGSSDDEAMDGTGTVHTVETLIRAPPTNPNRPVDFFFQPTGLHIEPGDVVKFVFRTPDHNVVAYHPAFGMRRRVPIGVTAFSSPLLGWRPESIPGDQIEPPAEMGGEEEDSDADGSDDEDDDAEDGASDDETDDGSNGSDDDNEDGDDSDGEGPVPDTWLHAFETPGVYDLLCSPHEGYGMAMRVVVGDVTETEFETSNPEDLPEPRAGPVGLARVTLTDPALQPSYIVSEGTVLWETLTSNQQSGPDNGGEES
ncbi:plastocyanin/azurin family copper-binding protein [Halobellus sp. Atlit-38R]|uniref:plastocyanin/azurin family copper-binding protein n=1 Tax=Halobellus sp. Atlit-38R TaxID=2282131 RepID=UPI00131462CD|nr:plastocyanin/azurin family copper-binding protein [Halobellus sp. Atlit-38R]